MKVKVKVKVEGEGEGRRLRLCQQQMRLDGLSWLFIIWLFTAPDGWRLETFIVLSVSSFQFSVPTFVMAHSQHDSFDRPRA